MSERVDAAMLPADAPHRDETEFAREDVSLLSRTMLLTAADDMAVVRIFGTDKGGNVVRVGLSPERAVRLGAAFIRAGLRLKPQLRAQVIEDGNAAELQAMIDGSGTRG